MTAAVKRGQNLFPSFHSTFNSKAYGVMPVDTLFKVPILLMVVVAFATLSF